METVREKRVLRLEKRRAIADQKKSYCGCRCHRKNLGDFMEITDEYAEEVYEIFERLGSYQLPDGTWRSRAEDLEEREKNRPPCTCKCNH